MHRELVGRRAVPDSFPQGKLWVNLMFTIQDSVIGIKKKNLDKIFRSFSQVDTKKNRSIKGMGIGLASSKQLVRKRKEGIVPDMAFLIPAGASYEFRQFLLQELKERMPWKTVVVNKASATISCNCGSGAFGILFLRK